MPRTAKPSKGSESYPLEAGSKKSDDTRRRIREAAFSLFAERGYSETTMRSIADRAGCALGLIYRYYRQREDLALELFTQSVQQDVQHRIDLAGKHLAEGFAESVHRRIEDLGPHRDTLRALASSALDRESPVSLLGPATAAVRDQVITSFRALIDAAPDAPSDDEERARIARAMFVGQLMVILAWLQDPSPQARHTHALIDLLGETVRLLVPTLPIAGPLLGRYDRLLNAFIEAR